MSIKRSGMFTAGVVLIAFGLLALLGELFRGFHFWSYFWPFIIVAFGGLFFIGMLAGGKSVSGLAIPGSIISVIGLMLFFQNLTNHWESWAYGWTVILMSVGLGIFIMGAWTGNEHQRRAGLRVLEVGAILFVIFGGLFEMIFFSFGGAGISQFVFPGLLILLGIYLVVVRSGLVHFGRKDAMLDQPVKPEEKQ
jgi:hypothetical protein